MPIEDFIRARAMPMAAPEPMQPAPAPTRPARAAAPPEAAPGAMPTIGQNVGQTLDNFLRAVEQMGPEVIRWAQDVAALPAEMQALREQLDRIEALLTPPDEVP